MYKNIFGCFVVLVLSFGCKEDLKPIVPQTDNNSQDEVPSKRAFSDGDYNFQLEYNNRLDTSYFDVLFKGNKISRQGFKGKVKEDFLADLDRDKKNELFLVVSYNNRSSLFAYRFVDGKAIEIKKEDFRDFSKVKAQKFTFENGQLVERFIEISKEGTLDKELRYNLVERDNEFILLPQGWLPGELKNMGGQYAARDAKGAGYYKVMLLTQGNGGEWNIDIKVKMNSDKKVICDFIGKGYFYDKNLIVPLNNVSSKLGGMLKIRFLDLLAIVYTEDVADSKEMISFCNGEGSIAGNFKKTNI